MTFCKFLRSLRTIKKGVLAQIHVMPDSERKIFLLSLPIFFPGNGSAANVVPAQGI